MRQFNIRGFSLVELLITSVIGILLSLGILEIYISSKEGFFIQSELRQIQESGSFVMEKLKQDLRNADNWGCTEALTNNLLSSGTGYIDYVNESVKGSDSTIDTLKIHYAEVNGEQLTTAMTSTSDTISVATGNIFSQDDTVVVSDCIRADIFQITNNDPDTTGTLSHSNTGGSVPGNASTSLSYAYDTKAHVYTTKDISYYISTGAQGEPALFRNENGTVEELVDGLENMQIKYGIDTDGDASANRYVDASAVTDWKQVVSLRVHLLFRSDDNVAINNQTYIFNNSKYTASDYKIRREFSTTINIRNRKQA